MLRKFQHLQPCKAVSKPCEVLARIRTCVGDDICQPCSYRLEYVDRSSAWGTLPHEKFAFEDPFGNPVDVGASIIDSGTTYTMLRQEAFDALVKALREAIQLPQRRGPQCSRCVSRTWTLQERMRHFFYKAC
ncbi:hypothetical protein ACFX1X_022223 [Malus domestica]